MLMVLLRLPMKHSSLNPNDGMVALLLFVEKGSAMGQQATCHLHHHRSIQQTRWGKQLSIALGEFKLFFASATESFLFLI
mmetsp:Transcript_20220/g.50301  ORF Transcript_20220/g.50301 Transcript_20220/m.50301 type:complete len:80 (+) Transcript_20220:231-470(+)